MYLQCWHGWCHMKRLPSWRVLCTPYNHTPCHFMQSHIHKVHAYIAVTCHLYFWQNDQGLLRATEVTQGWNRYQNKSQHRKLTPEKKTLPPLLQGFEPTTFRSWVRRSNHWTIPILTWTTQLLPSPTNESLKVGVHFSTLSVFSVTLQGNPAISTWTSALPKPDCKCSPCTEQNMHWAAEKGEKRKKKKKLG